MRKRARPRLGSVVLLLLAAWLAAWRPAETEGDVGHELTAEERGADFDELATFVRDRYAYLSDKATDWNAVAAHYRPLAVGAQDKRAFIAVLESALDELYDPHTHLGVNLASSWRLPPYDIWAEWKGARAVVTEVRRGSAAERAGAVAGMQILEVDGQPLEEALALRRPHYLRHPDPEAEAWALRSLLAGRHDRARELVVLDASGARQRLHIGEAEGSTGEPAVSSRRLSSEIGYVRIATFSDEGAVNAFDRALADLRETKALVIDVRDNPGGDTAIARPIMGRLLGARTRYAWMARREGAGLGPRWPEFVDPRGPWTYGGRVVVLVNHWSESMAEGFAMGLHGMGRATVVGTRMAGLGAGIARETLAHSGIAVQISAEPVYDASGRPRTELRPDVLVDPVGARGGDAALDAALRLLRRPRGR